VIQRYVIELRVSGGITELAGQMSQAVFTARTSQDTRVDEVFLPESYAEFADKVVALDGARRELIKLVTQSSAFGTAAARLLSAGLVELLFRKKAGSEPREVRHRARGEKGGLREELERRFGSALVRFPEQRAEGLSRGGERLLVEVLDDDCVRWIADEIWDTVSRMKLSDAFAFISAHDLEDFVVLGYEFWLKYRKTRYFRAICDEVVDRFFAKYGDETVVALIEDMGVTEQMVTHELQVFVSPVFEHADRTGFVEAQVRERLTAFYASADVQSLLSAHTP
jgi:hypothetical protein